MSDTKELHWAPWRPAPPALRPIPRPADWMPWTPQAGYLPLSEGLPDTNEGFIPLAALAALLRKRISPPPGRQPLRPVPPIREV